MPVNEFLPFGLGAGANVATQATWANEVSRTTGFQAGVAKSAHANKVIRQSAFVAHVVAQMVADGSGFDALDNGDVATFKARLMAAVKAVAQTQGVSDDLANYKKVVEALFAQMNGQLGATNNALAATVARFAPLETKTGGRLLASAAYGAPGSYNHPFQPDCSWFTFELVGGGGAGGGAKLPPAGQASVGSGGGAGGFTSGIYFNRKARIGPSIAILIGAAGAPVTGGRGGNGGATTLGNLATAFGGGGGDVVGPTSAGCGNNGAGAPGGSVYSEAGFGNGTAINCGAGGTTGIILHQTAALSGQGGAGPWGGGGGAVGQNSGGAGGSAWGAGGGGACLLAGQGPGAGGPGGPGFARIMEYS